MISDKVFKTADEFVEVLYSDEDRLKRIREHLRIRGFGFDFETKYTVSDEPDETRNVEVTDEDKECEPNEGGKDEVQG